MQTLLNAVYPPSCLTCGGLTAENGALCGPCWRETPFIMGAACDACGTPLAGAAEVGTGPALCDTCLSIARPWTRGRAALVYSGKARDLVLKLKHADRHDIAAPAAGWLARAARDLIAPGTLIVPIPLHWSRRLKRRYNQAGLLADALSRKVERPVCHDALTRIRRTPSLDGARREARFDALSGAIAANPKRAPRLAGASVLIVDDVMTSGATCAAATEAAYAAGAQDVCVVALARVAKDA
ncbi:Predicted amidophosphoribosyltransferases [Roseivivax lentus]|uniref:Predicted amidophosphoribosyltransferases n=1 Tax=Roseivivax lentus TaxID=633194 RepID=A0A1N7JS67_9RHOB|nr:double zinc ribbon domain-containing protein [Roseivivax lentus]SIS52121.1 Predicted amidophosphoribosyltransferases [Roseivivax lentus]